MAEQEKQQGAPGRGKRPSAKDARARMGRAVSAQSPQSRAIEEAGEATANGAPAQASTAATEKLVRLSVDVPRSQHRYLRVLAAESGVTGMAVIRALLDETSENPELAARVRERLGESV